MVLDFFGSIHLPARLTFEIITQHQMCRKIGDQHWAWGRRNRDTGSGEFVGFPFTRISDGTHAHSVHPWFVRTPFGSFDTRIERAWVSRVGIP